MNSNTVSIISFIPEILLDKSGLQEIYNLRILAWENSKWMDHMN